MPELQKLIFTIRNRRPRSAQHVNSVLDSFGLFWRNNYEQRAKPFLAKFCNCKWVYTVNTVHPLLPEIELLGEKLKMSESVLVLGETEGLRKMQKQKDEKETQHLAHQRPKYNQSVPQLPT